MGQTRKRIIPYAKMLAENGYRLYATKHTAEDLQAKGIPSSILHKVRERKKPNILDYLTNKEIKLVINIPSTNGGEESRQILEDEYIIRRKAAEFGIPVVTNLELARALVKSLIKHNERTNVRTASREIDPSLEAVERTELTRPDERKASGETPIPVAPLP